MKVVSHSGYDVMRIEVEETPWWGRIFNTGPRRSVYTGSQLNWRDGTGGLVLGKKRVRLEQIWSELRAQTRAARDKARGR